MTDPRENAARAMLDAIEKRLDEARLRDDYDSIRVDLLAIIKYIERQLRLIENMPPPDDPA